LRGPRAVGEDSPGIGEKSGRGGVCGVGGKDQGSISEGIPWTPNGRLSSNTQTAYALALAFGLLPDSQRAEAAARLAADVKKFGHLTTGFLGTPVLCQTLSDYGYLDEAYMLLNEGVSVVVVSGDEGSDTIWERWDGIKPDGSFQDAGMNSFNHYAYGAIGELDVPRGGGD